MRLLRRHIVLLSTTFGNAHVPGGSPACMSASAAETPNCVDRAIIVDEDL
jgi:hypothetical protein